MTKKRIIKLLIIVIKEINKINKKIQEFEEQG